MYDLVKVTYCKALTMLLYRVGFLKEEPSETKSFIEDTIGETTGLASVR